MKVLFITPSCPVPAHSGAAVAALETLRSIESRCDLHLLTTPSDSEADQKQLQRELPGTSVHHYRPRALQAGRLEMYSTAAKVLIAGDSYWARMWFNRDL